jgi:hypothetical protein
VFWTLILGLLNSLDSQATKKRHLPVSVALRLIRERTDHRRS